MNKEIATILKNRIADLPFIDKLAGMVQTVQIPDTDAAGKRFIRKFPVSYDVDVSDISTVEQDLMPNSSKKSIIYFEDKGTNSKPLTQKVTSFSSFLRLVVWLNKNLLTGDAYSEITSTCAMMIKKKIETGMKNEGVFICFRPKIVNIPPQSAAIFSQYTYDEANNQYLRPPYDFFALDITVEYRMNTSCIPNINFNNPAQCP